MSGSVCCHVAHPPKYCALITATCADDTEGLKNVPLLWGEKSGLSITEPPVGLKKNIQPNAIQKNCCVGNLGWLLGCSLPLSSPKHDGGWDTGRRFDPYVSYQSNPTRNGANMGAPWGPYEPYVTLRRVDLDGGYYDLRANMSAMGEGLGVGPVHQGPRGVQAAPPRRWSRNQSGEVVDCLWRVVLWGGRASLDNPFCCAVWSLFWIKNWHTGPMPSKLQLF